MTNWSRPAALEALSFLAYRLGRVPVQDDLHPPETPSRNWYTRNYPGGWRQAVKDATGMTACLPGHPQNRFIPDGPNIGFRNPEILAKAIQARTHNADFNPHGGLVAPA